MFLSLPFSYTYPLKKNEGIKLPITRLMVSKKFKKAKTLVLYEGGNHNEAISP
jgi:hypothetical protein